MNKHYNSLELPKILEMLSAFTSCPDAREAALNLQPEHNLKMAEAQE